MPGEQSCRYLDAASLFQKLSGLHQTRRFNPRNAAEKRLFVDDKQQFPG
jgi:hypothetical protein